MIKLVMSDIDGTLMNVGKNRTVREERPSDKVYELIKELKSKGYMFCASSGRQYPSLKKLFAPVSDGMFFSCENGSTVVYKDKVISQNLIKRETAECLIKTILAESNAQPLISGPMVSYLINPSDDFYDCIKNYLGNVTVVVSSVDEIKEGIQKVAIYKPDGIADIAGRYKDEWGDKLNVAEAGSIWLDFTPGDKGDGLRMVCSAAGIEPCEVLAFGDNFNDIPMLSAAGLSFAMEAADSQVKAAASGVCADVVSKCRELLF
ncbi:MAG: HAD-IIB family hydrolase [Acutalibacteraceae bacterium]